MKTRPVREILADNVRRLMRERPALDTQPKLAAKAGMSQSSINRLLAGQTDALLVSVLDLAKAFGVSVNELIEDPLAARNDVIAYDRQRYAELSEENKAKIATFIEFVIATSHIQPKSSSSTTLNTVESIEPSPVRRARVRDASQSSISRDALSTNENKDQPKSRGRRTSGH
ncbi:helix-turn-helix transcriptional regulator [Burkholderia sp. R-69980]|nr:helix-turn-helix transcriptional regulator [Burkholderia sp. R-69980]